MSKSSKSDHSYISLVESSTWMSPKSLLPSLSLNFLALLILEVPFVDLTWFPFSRPLPIPYVDNSDLSTVKSAFVAFFNVWHTVAVAVASTTCLITFSLEWAAGRAAPEDVGSLANIVQSVGQGFILPTNYKINFLTGLPTADLKRITGQGTSPPLATLLIYDPQLRFTSGAVELNPTADPSSLDIRVVLEDKLADSLTKNIDQPIVRTLFSWALSKAGGPVSDELSNSTDSMGLPLFFTSGMKIQNDDVWHLTPPDLRLIKEHMGSYTLPAFKTFTSGFTGSLPSSGESVALNTATVSALYENGKLALRASILFISLHSGLFVAQYSG